MTYYGSANPLRIVWTCVVPVIRRSRLIQRWHDRLNFSRGGGVMLCPCGNDVVTLLRDTGCSPWIRGDHCSGEIFVIAVMSVCSWRRRIWLSPLGLVPYIPRKAGVITIFRGIGLLFNLTSYSWRIWDRSMGYNDPLDFQGRAGVGSGYQGGVMCARAKTFVVLPLQQYHTASI